MKENVASEFASIDSKTQMRNFNFKKWMLILTSIASICISPLIIILAIQYKNYKGPIL